jgi:hypothetical protein
LIAPDIILTAGHVNPPLEQPVKVRVDHAQFQSTNFSMEPDDDETFSIVAIQRHPGFYTVSWDEAVNDYNIFKISGFSKQKPVKLNRNPSIPHAGDRVTIIGMGSMDPNPDTFMETAATHLQEVNLTVLSQQECEASYDPARPNTSYLGRVYKENMVCTTGGHLNHKDACAFDSGSPVLLTPSNSDQQEDLVVALVSWGEDCADPFFPAVNARIDYAMDWICQTVCNLTDADPSLLKEFDCRHEGWFQLQSSSSFNKSIFASSKACFWAFMGFLFSAALAAVLVVHRRRRQVGAVKVSERAPLQSADAIAVHPSSYDAL